MYTYLFLLFELCSNTVRSYLYVYRQPLTREPCIPERPPRLVYESRLSHIPDVRTPETPMASVLAFIVVSVIRKSIQNVRYTRQSRIRETYIPANLVLYTGHVWYTG